MLVFLQVPDKLKLCVNESVFLVKKKKILYIQFFSNPNTNTLPETEVNSGKSIFMKTPAEASSVSWSQAAIRIYSSLNI